MVHAYNQHELTDEDRRAFLKALGVTGAVGVGGLTLEGLQGTIEGGETEPLEETGRAIKSSLAGELDAGLLATGVSDLSLSLSEMAEMGAGARPTERANTFAQLAEPGWAVKDHLAEVGFYGVAEAEIPTFTPERIGTSMQKLVNSGTLASLLSGVGFTSEERTDLAVDVVANNEFLSQWLPADMYGEEAAEGFNPENIAPLHQRAAEGSLLWFDKIDQHLWQNEVLLTDELYQRGLIDAKNMLGGLYLMTHTAERLARNDIGDADLTALLTTSSAALILNQVALADDLFRVREQGRAPSGGEV
jgi:hypothetical protein